MIIQFVLIKLAACKSPVQRSFGGQFSSTGAISVCIFAQCRLFVLSINLNADWEPVNCYTTWMKLFKRRPLLRQHVLTAPQWLNCCFHSRKWNRTLTRTPRTLAQHFCICTRAPAENTIVSLLWCRPIKTRTCACTPLARYTVTRVQRHFSAGHTSASILRTQIHTYSGENHGAQIELGWAE